MQTAGLFLQSFAGTISLQCSVSSNCGQNSGIMLTLTRNPKSGLKGHLQLGGGRAFVRQISGWPGDWRRNDKCGDISASNEGYPKVRNHGEGPY